MTQDIALYAAKEVWDQSLQPGQANLLQALRDFWPSGITSVLDVGCGDGKMTAHLVQSTKNTRFVGLDSSAEALSRLPFESVEGDATALPFADNAFDLVMTTDMLEHLPEAQEDAAWHELFRVATKTIMVAVPFREDLSEALARCPNCGHVYHVNWHMRRYDISDLYRRTPADWRVHATVLTGAPWSQMLPPEIHARRTLLGETTGWELSVCPECGAHGSVPTAQHALPSLLAQSLATQIYPSLLQRRWCRSHSEILLVFQRRRRKKTEPVTVTTHPQPASCIVFSHQPAGVNLAPFCQVAGYVIDPQGQLRLQFPLYEPAPILEIQRKPGTQGPLQLLLEDAEGILLNGQVLGADQDHANISLPRPPVVGYYGILASCTSDAFASIRLGQGPEIIWLHPPSAQESGYWRSENADDALFVQVCTPLWWDPLTLADEPQYDPPPAGQLFAHIQAYCERAVMRLRSMHAQESNTLCVQIQNLESECSALREQRDAQLVECNRLEAIMQDVISELEALATQRDTYLHACNALNAQFQSIEFEYHALNEQHAVLSAKWQEFTAHVEQLGSRIRHTPNDETSK